MIDDVVKKRLNLISRSPLLKELKKKEEFVDDVLAKYSAGCEHSNSDPYDGLGPEYSVSNWRKCNECGDIYLDCFPLE